jgi:hypothetical protein
VLRPQPRDSSGGNVSKHKEARPAPSFSAHDLPTNEIIWLYTILLQLTLISPLQRSDGQRFSLNRRIHRPFLSGSIFVNTESSPGSDEDRLHTLPDALNLIGRLLMASDAFCFSCRLQKRFW